MIELQVLSRVMRQKNMSFLTLNGITDDYFITYKDEYEYIKNHVQEYGNVPDAETFLNKFPEFTIVDVTETDKYLIDTFNEEHLYSITVPVITKVAEYLQTDSKAAVEYLQSMLPQLAQKTAITGVDIISTASTRLEQWNEKKTNKDQYFIPTGFEELDEILGGWSRGEELVVIFARTGQGKTWILLKSLEHAWKMNKVVGLLEPEMSPVKTGYRFDTLHGNISSRALMRGDEIEEYANYIEALKKSDTPFFVAHPSDFKRKVTVSKLKSWVAANKIEVLAIDGITYLTDERHQRGDNKTTALTNISEDLMDLSIELKIPVIIVSQSNREGISKDNDEAPSLENIRDSDGIAHNASTVIAAKQKGPGIELSIRKNRNGTSGDKLLYYWDPDKGIFRYVPSEESPVDDSAKIQEARNAYQDGSEIF
mgnify:CR=1 FL=1